MDDGWICNKKKKPHNRQTPSLALAEMFWKPATSDDAKKKSNYIK